MKVSRKAGRKILQYKRKGKNGNAPVRFSMAKNNANKPEINFKGASSFLKFPREPCTLKVGIRPISLQFHFLNPRNKEVQGRPCKGVGKGYYQI